MWFRKRGRVRRLGMAIGSLLLVAGITLAARGDLPAWLQNIEAETPLDRALYRSMPLPGGDVFMRRPPAEARPLVDQLVASHPSSADLRSLRAMEEEQQLDFVAAQKDWTFYAEHAGDRTSAELALADFYRRRLRPGDEIRALSVVARAPARPSEALLPAREQQAWLAFERIFGIIHEENLPGSVADGEYRAWLERYPRAASVYAAYLQFLLSRKEYDRAASQIAAYRRAFPEDVVFTVKARALLEYTKGDIKQGLAIYDSSFQPLWPQDLIDGYFSLLRRTDNLRKFLARSRAALEAHPDDLNALARVFDYYQETGKPLAARGVIDKFRQQKETAGTPWTGEELYTVARLLERIDEDPDAARYYFALYSAGGASANRQRALAGLIRILLQAPQQPIRLGAGDLSLYKDIATMDPGPGFLNGILSLLFNSARPAGEFSSEEQRAIPYFHYAEAARLLALLDRNFPKAPGRAALHARLLQVYVQYGESAAVIRLGRQFLSDFPAAPQRTHVALLMAGADARLGNTADEFAVYDGVLRELAEKARGMPLGTDTRAPGRARPGNEWGTEPGPFQPRYMPGPGAAGQGISGSDFALAPTQGPPNPPAASEEYSRVLERYLARLSALHRIPEALVVLRREVDRNPNDPGLYERLAQFLEQNQLGAQEEEVYRRAIEKFPTRSWYQRLARFYLRHKREAAMEQLSRQVVRIFAGSDLQDYFQNVVGDVGPQLYLRLNLYAHRRFPHNLVFVRNLLGAYHNPATADGAAWERLLRQHWFEDAGLRSEFFRDLTWTGQLDTSLAALRAANPEMRAGRWQEAAQKNPAAVDFYAEAQLWRSHFENGLPALAALAQKYPADFDFGRRASALCRSLAYFNPQDTEAAVAIEKNLLRADPGNRDTLARIGDIYGDRDRLGDAAPYWSRIADVHPGRKDSYLDAATIYWDYYRFEDALRLLDEGRRRLHDPALFRYQEGAIYENQRDYPRAIQEYVRGVLADGGDSQADFRLLRLAARPGLASLVERETASLASEANPPLAQIRLRLDILEARKRKDDARAFLLALLGRTTSLTLAEQVESLAEQHSLASVRRQALEQEASLTTDPVHRLEIRYKLVRFFEGENDYAAAQQAVEALYRENPKILGVVRATVDFYWQRKMRQRAIAVLLEAAQSSYPELRDQFDFEAARKATEDGNDRLARQLLAALLRRKPYDGELLAAMADTYARAGDDAGLRDFYLATIADFRGRPAAPAGAISSLRRGLIPALTRLKDFTGAVDQYIELINRYPEDESLVDEAALYAAQAGLAGRLASFYARAVARSPRDVRWSVVLARIQKQLEDYPAAVSTYSKAIAVRPDREDLYIARADLLERLMRFDDAASDYTKLYALSYDDPQWMLKVAETRARQGRAAEAVAALKSAWIDGHPASPTRFFSAAQSLESWGLLPQAADFAQQGMRAAGDDLLADPANLSGARLYARLLTRLRREQEAYGRLQAALDAASAPSLPFASTAKQVGKQGLAAVTEAEWRERERRIRSAAGSNGFQACLEEMGRTVHDYFAPEEKQAFARYLEGKSRGMAAAEIERFLIPLAGAAGLRDLEVRWLHQVLLANPANFMAGMQRLVTLQSRRLRFKPLAGWLESFAPLVRYEQRGYVLSQAAEAYRSAGDDTDELRVLEELDRPGWLPPDDPRYFALLRSHDPQILVELSRNGGEARRNASAEFAVASGNAPLAYNAVLSRGWGLPPVWTQAYFGLVGLYYADPAAAVDSAFRAILDQGTIGQRLGKKVDRSRQLAGAIWFYYASRYGEYLGVTHQGNPEDDLPAILEESPGRAGAYLVTADDYADAGNLPRAIADFRHALALDPSRADVRDRLAVLDWKAGRHSQAVAEWRLAFAVLEAQAKRGTVPGSFSSEFRSITLHVQQEHLATQFRAPMDRVLREYIRHSGAYGASPLLRSAYETFANHASATAWLLSLAPAASSPDSFLALLVDAEWMPRRKLEPIYERILTRRKAAVAQSEGSEKDVAEAALRQWQRRWLLYLIEIRQFERARQTLDSLAQSAAGSAAPDLAPLRLRLAAETNNLDALLRDYRTAPQTAPSLEVLRQAAMSFDRAGETLAAHRVLAFAYSREIENHNLTAANFLGLAEIQLESGNMKAALDLLNRLTLVVGPPFANLDSAAALLEKTRHPAEAAIFLDPLVRATPWDTAARVRLARARLAAGGRVSQARKDLLAMASDGSGQYPLRAEAALALAPRGGAANLGSAELNLLAGGGAIAFAQANRPFYLPARLQAAAGRLANAEKTELLRMALADWPGNRPARLRLFHLAVAAQDDRLALSDLSPLLAATSLGFREPAWQPRGRFGAFGMNGARQTNLPPLFAEEPPAERLRLVTELATVTERLGRLEDAVRYLQVAESLERLPTRRAGTRRQIARLQTELERMAANARRRPQIHRQLDQDRIVRPRLVARGASRTAPQRNSP
jgi:predicted Zn-dependent protease